MKSGTTSLFRHRAGHPQIAACRVKEPKFFSHDAASPCLAEDQATLRDELAFDVSVWDPASAR